MNRFIARQPIFDRSNRVVAYELLHRLPGADGFDGSDPEQATIGVIDDTMHLFGGELLGHGRRAFINMTAAVLFSDVVEALPPESTVLEVLETVEPTPKLVARCAELRSAGYRIALDDFAPHPKYADLLGVADIVKVDFLAATAEQRAQLERELLPRGIELLAEKVEDHDVVQRARDAGYSLFQGYYYARPEVLERRSPPRFKRNYLLFLSELGKPELDRRRVERIIEDEPSLCVRLLRYVNSSAVAPQHRVSSLRQALVHLGENPLRQWGSLVAVSALGDDKPDELVVTSWIRGRFCQQLGARLPGEDHHSLFLVGLLSTLDAFMDQPLGEALSQVALVPEISNAILGDDSPASRALALVRAFERADWQGVATWADRLGLDDQAIEQAYREAAQAAGALFTQAA